MKELEIPAAFYTKAGSGRKNEKRVKQANRRVQKKFRQAKIKKEDSTGEIGRGGKIESPRRSDL